MVQFYMLSILLNILAGLILIWRRPLSEDEGALVPSVADEPFSDDGTDPSPASDSDDGHGFSQMDSKVFRLVVGILSVFVGIMKFLSVYRNDVPVVGDLLPAIAGLLGGAALLVDYYLASTTEDTELPGVVQTVFLDSRKFVGIACLAAAVLHFLFPGVVLF